MRHSQRHQAAVRRTGDVARRYVVFPHFAAVADFFVAGGGLAWLGGVDEGEGEAEGGDDGGD